MSDATGKIIGSMFLNGVIHTILPALGIAGYMKLAEAPNLQSTNAFLTVLVFIVLGSVCGKLFQTEHIATLAGYGVIISIVFFSLSWHVGFIGNLIRNSLQEEENSEPDQFVESIVHAFYMFWAGMYSAASLSWFATACPLPAV